MNEVFADTFYYVALLNPADQHHASAVSLTGELRARMVTTTCVLMEVADALSHPAIRLHTHAFLVGLAADANTVIVPMDARWYERGLRLFGQRRDKNWTLTDCISFEVMAARHVSEALTGDHHFAQAGFRPLFTTRGQPS